MLVLFVCRFDRNLNKKNQSRPEYSKNTGFTTIPSLALKSDAAIGYAVNSEFMILCVPVGLKLTLGRLPDPLSDSNKIYANLHQFSEDTNPCPNIKLKYTI